MSFQTEELGKGAATAGRLLKRAPFSISFSLPSLPGVAIVMGIGHGQHEQLKGQDKLSVFRQRTWKRTTPYWSVWGKSWDERSREGVPLTPWMNEFNSQACSWAPRPERAQQKLWELSSSPRSQANLLVAQAHRRPKVAYQRLWQLSWHWNHHPRRWDRVAIWKQLGWVPAETNKQTKLTFSRGLNRIKTTYYFLMFRISPNFIQCTKN